MRSFNGASMRCIPNNLQIHEAGPSESEAISDLIVASARAHILPELSEAGGQHLLANLDRSSLKRFRSQGYRYYVATSGMECVGVAGVRPPSHLYHLFVRVGWENLGIGAKLWQHVRDHILGKEPQAVITVNASPNAVVFYEKLGFVCNGPEMESDEVHFQPMIYTPQNSIPTESILPRDRH